jgi:2-succinyl-5-enolpyruvyl-6-hydroxy-3-cyclohexene-1-carboxylate synthase
MAEGYQPVVVCVTSGSALLNLYPAVAEAYYQQIPLIVISADRPAQWINQLDGQTLPQPDALGQMVRKAVSLPEVFEGEQQEEMHWYCNRLVNEALLKSMGRVKGPVHINVPISEPFYSFTKEALPVERKIEVAYCRANIDTFDGTPFECVLKAKRPLLVIGQLDNTEKYVDLLAYIDRMPILWESLAMPPYLYKVQEELGEDWNKTTLYGAFENLLDEIKDDERFRPDLVVYIGGHIVSKKLKSYLRSLKGVEQIRISQEADIEDTFMHLTKVMDLPNSDAMSWLGNFGWHNHWEDYRKLWMDALAKSYERKENFKPEFSSLATVKEFFSQLQKVEPQDFKAFTLGDKDAQDDGIYDRKFDTFLPGMMSSVFSGNSSAIRLMNLYADRHVYCNRGVNGIEGSLSTAVGFSMCKNKSDKHVYCVLGDLSFFYDQNALWNRNLNGKLRIIVLNNGGGAIFGKFQGLKESQAREEMIMAKHHATAEGICSQNDVKYLAAHTMEEMEQGISQLIHAESERPMLLEVFTDMDVDNEMLEAIQKC